MTDRSVTKQQYVCDAVYSPFANAMADCQICGWQVSRHKTTDSTGKGPFCPGASLTSKYEIVGLDYDQAHRLADALCGTAVFHEGHAWVNERCVVRPQGCQCFYCQILTRSTEQRSDQP